MLVCYVCVFQFVWDVFVCALDCVCVCVRECVYGCVCVSASVFVCVC